MFRTEYIINVTYHFIAEHKGAPYTFDMMHFMNAGEFKEFVKTFGNVTERKVVRLKKESSKMIRWFEERIA